MQSIPEGKITVVEDVLQNYRDYKGGELFYRYCIDYTAIDERGYCPEATLTQIKQKIGRTPDSALDEDINIRNKLLEARALFAVLLVAEPTSLRLLGVDILTENPDGTIAMIDGVIDDRPDGKDDLARHLGHYGLLETTREIANAHLIFGNEYLVDALDYRFSSTATTGDLIIGQELEQLGDSIVDIYVSDYIFGENALDQFSLAVDVLAQAFNADIGWPRKAYVADYFTRAEFERFGIASERMVHTMDEIANRRRQLGQDNLARSIYSRGSTAQYLQALGLAEKAAAQDVDFLNNGGWTMMTNLGRLRAQSQALNDGLNPFGFTGDFVPLQPYTNLRELTKNEFLRDATEDEQAAQAAQREFDQNFTQVNNELQGLRLTYDNRLLELCGASTDDYLTCNGGMMEQNFLAMVTAADRIGLAIQLLENIPQQIQIEQDRAGQVINLTLQGGQQLSLLSYAIGVQNSYRVTESAVNATTDEWHAGVENRTTVTFGSHIGIPPSFGVSVENSTSVFVGISHSQSKTSSMTKVWDPAAKEIGFLNGLRDVQQAATQAEIIGANSEATIRNLLLQQATLLIELDIAIDEYNQLAAEHNLIVEQYRNWLNLRVQAQDNLLDSYLNNPAYRILRESLTVEASRSHNVTAQFAYLTAKSLEYEFLTPFPETNNIFKARTADDIDNYLNDLEQWRVGISNPGDRNRFPYVISIAEDILGLSDENLDPDDVLSPTERAQLRYALFQTFLNANRDANRVQFSFPTSLLDNQIFSQNIWNNRIAGVGLPTDVAGTEGVSINVVTRQLSDAGTPQIILGLGGHTSYRTVTNNIVEYTPRNARLVGYEVPSGFDPKTTTAVILSHVNGNGQGTPTSALFNRSVAASNWIVRIDLTDPFNADLDITQIEDIQVLMDSTGFALPLSGLSVQSADINRESERLIEEFEQAKKRSSKYILSSSNE
ncbi:MAG: hypothetical protein KDJ97_12340 [Anaerolineae bacterium]|nr:hypothetical protein [Anaerolineae bacterium]